MSEVVDYNGKASGFESSDEREEFIELAEGFQDADVPQSPGDDGTISFYVGDGWRGAGRTCEEIVKRHFGEWLSNHPHIDLTVHATYLEHAPRDCVYTSKGGS